MKYAVIFLLTIFCNYQIANAQPAYNNCNTAFEVCPNESYSFDNTSANVTFCPGCEDDFNFCFATDNTIWITFTTNAAGGDVQVDFSNLVFNNNPGQDTELQASIIQAGVPCDATSYTQIGNCVSNATANFALNAAGLPGNTTYYIVVDGDNNGAGITSAAECAFDLSISGTGVDRAASSITPSTTTPSSCYQDVVTYTATFTDCPDSTDLLWFVNGNLVATTSDPFFQTSDLEDGDVVSVQTTCYTQCVDTVSGIAVPQSVFTIFVDAGNDLTITQGEDIQLFGNTSASVYSWSPSFLVSSSTILNPIAQPTETTTFTLTAEQNGCVLSDQVTIIINSELVIPNTFSPNGDDNNDTWVIDGIEKYPDNRVVVYSRWGQEVFSATNYTAAKAWDGTVRDRKVTEGVYYYVIDLRTEGEELKKGSLTIIR